MASNPGSWKSGLRFVVVAVTMTLSVGLAGCAATPPPSAMPTSTSPSAESPSPAPTPTSASPSGTPTATPSVSAIPTPTPTAVKAETPYCKAFGKIAAGGVEPDESEGAVDFVALGKRFDSLIVKYSAAAKLAPDSLKDDYAKVLRYLRQGKAAVASRDLKELKTMIENLSSLNDAMDSIQQESKLLCE